MCRIASVVKWKGEVCHQALRAEDWAIWWRIGGLAEGGAGAEEDETGEELGFASGAE